MSNWKTNIYLCFTVLKLIWASVASFKGSPVRTLEEEDIVKCSRSQNFDFYQTNHLTPIEKQSKLENRVDLLAEFPDFTPISINGKRNFKQAFDNREGNSMKPPDGNKVPNLSSPFVSDWGDDLMFFATEWDVFPAYNVESYIAEIQNNLAIAHALENSVHNYQGYYPQNNVFWENIHWLSHQAESLGARSKNSPSGTAETQVSRNQNLEQSSPHVNLPLKSVIESETTASLGEDNNNALTNKIRQASRLDADVLSSNKIYGDPRLPLINNNPNSSYTRARINKIKLLETEDLRILEKQKSQAMCFGKKDNFEEKDKPQSSRCSLQVFLGQADIIQKKIKNEYSEVKRKKSKTICGQEKSIKDAMDEYMLKLDYLSISSSNKSPLGLLLETIDNYADKKSEKYHEKRKQVHPIDLKLYNHNHFVKSFLGQRAIPISQPMLEKLHKAFKNLNEKTESYQKPEPLPG
ncbi:hypothetical protein BY996DRAFT_6414666 [Phakopsora pachyrhizi]|nr:hypothetical protein BY996DRAFT_6414666 [Phakopsora pachyrhizi]